MIQDIRRLLDAYHAWHERKIARRQTNQWMEITTLYLDRHNYYLQIYVKHADDGFVLADDGYMVDDLEKAECKLENRRRQDLLQMTLHGFDVRMDSKALQVHVSSDNFALRKHNQVQAMLSVNEVFYLAVWMMAGLLYEDVASIEQVGSELHVGEDTLADRVAEPVDDFFLGPDYAVVPGSSPAKMASARPRRLFGVFA